VIVLKSLTLPMPNYFNHLHCVAKRINNKNTNKSGWETSKATIWRSEDGIILNWIF
jgi:hypothetical protein